MHVFNYSDPTLLLVLALMFSPLRDDVAREFCRSILLDAQLAAPLPAPLLESLRTVVAPPRLRLTTDD